MAAEQLDIKPKREAQTRLPDSVLEEIYEEWISYPRKYRRMPMSQHSAMSSQPGWWASGVRGMGVDLEPLAPDLATRLAERDGDRR